MDLHSRNGNGGAVLLPPTTKTIGGRGLVRRHLAARQRACVVADVLDGLTSVKLSQRQLADLLNVSIPYIMLARKLSAGKRAAILRGWDQTSFAERVRPPRQMSLWGPVIPDMKVIPDRALEELARIVGPERMLNAAAVAERS